MNNKVIRLDSMLSNIEKEKINVIRNFWTSDDNIVYQELEKAIIDTLEPGVIAKRYPKRFLRENIVIDSVLDLFPEKMPRIIIDQYDMQDDLEDIVLEMKENLKIQLDDKNEDMIIHFENGDNNQELKIQLKELNNQLNDNIRIIELENWYADQERNKRSLEKELSLFEEREFEFPNDIETEIVFGKRSQGSVADQLTNELLEDRLISKDKKSKIELSGKHFKINGDKQAKNIWLKYKEIYEEFSGLKMSKDSKLKFEIDPNLEQEREVNIFKRSI